ncbi:MAG: tRNA (guanosine(37)-N1)-methyltransferase TrmD [Bacillota bacterium]|jgi:tRNA (guanine37-N1)-methyltransferase|nr:tRNA (guanosine(37)-N1)-methyltransferase TrmD [Bacillota bacterium]HPZ21695.1 tRNA (guanosine(37)-N1)-methyltransferase TrmD [Bacillota bacterium]HQD19532.1 tRNA (guanosine(37)-N1)-methyltransferase TrmD [Bacillota bacterium]
MRIDIITIFPEIVEALKSYSMIKRATDRGLVTVNAINLRDFAYDKHKQVDDYTYGGGAGMVLKPEPLFRAVESLSSQNAPDEVIAMTPAGTPFDQKEAEDLSRAEHLILICGHYEGIDQRVLDHLATKELSIGDYILTGGELPAMVVADAVIRLLPGVLGNQESLETESFAGGILEYPQYTRPAEFRGLKVPEVLLSGNHQEIKEWRRAQALEKTKAFRPELLDNNERED